MTRAIIELLITIIVAWAARAILTSMFRGVSNAASQSAPNPPKQPGVLRGSELHKDPVCGTYVPETVEHRRQVGSEMFYYCSEKCRKDHQLVTRQ